MSIEAMKQALKAFEVATTPLARDRQEVLRAQAALRQAIEQAEKQEPVAWRVRWTDGSVSYRDQEPSEACQKECEVQPLYTTPQPQREWVGLPPADFDWLEQVFANKVSNDFVFADIVCVISAKLKDKNR